MQRAAIAILVLSTFVVFGRTLTHEFVRWDDRTLITDNAAINPPTIAGFLSAWRKAHEGMYIPITYNVWSIIAVLGRNLAWTNGPVVKGLASWPYHAANVLVHTTSAILILRLLHRGLGFSLKASLLAAMVFALHPLQVEAVCWATGMKDLLSTFLALSSISFYIWAARQWKRGELATGHINYSLALVLFFLGSLSKPGVIGAPLVACLLDLAFITPSVRKCLLRMIAPCLVLIPAVLVTSWAQDTGMPETLSPLYRPMVALHSLGFYASKLLVPCRLGVDYGLRPLVVVMDWRQMLFIWVAPGYLLLALILPRYRREMLLPAATIVFGTAPVLGFVPFLFQWYSTVADRYMYLAMLGPALAAAMVCNRSRLAVPVFAIVCIALGVLASRQVAVWQDTFTLMAHTIRVNPTASTAYQNIAASILQPLTDSADSLGSSRLRAAGLIAEPLLQAQMAARPSVMGPLRNMIMITALRGERQKAIGLNLLAMEAAKRFSWDASQGSLTPLEFSQLYSSAGDWRNAMKWLAIARPYERNEQAFQNTLQEILKQIPVGAVNGNYDPEIENP